ncbi:MAG: hypothetical protein IKG69_05280 [Atopobiaceae bacterium]|nr:hypothetical protein [Atopobiaceae bacterium]
MGTIDPDPTMRESHLALDSTLGGDLMGALWIFIMLLPACLIALVVLAMYALPILAYIALGLAGLVLLAFEKVSSAIRQGFMDAAIERKARGGMTPEQAREAVEREREERAHGEPSLMAMVLFWVVVFAVILVVGCVDARLHPLEPRTTTASADRGRPYRFETREGGLYDRERGYALPHVGMRSSEVDRTYYMGEHTYSETCDGFYDYVLVWEAKNGSHDPVLKAYVKDGVVLSVEYCYEPIYWTDESGLPDLYAEPLSWMLEGDSSTEP